MIPLGSLKRLVEGRRSPLNGIRRPWARETVNIESRWISFCYASLYVSLDTVLVAVASVARPIIFGILYVTSSF